MVLCKYIVSVQNKFQVPLCCVLLCHLGHIHTHFCAGLINMSHDELKAKGNACIQQKKYKEAIQLYSEALEVDPKSHTVYSNRSLAYSNLSEFDKALSDADRCIDISPNFARGYLRRAVACNGLGEHEKAMAAAEAGYKLRGSDSICRDSVSQWLVANKKVHEDMIKKHLDEMGLPENIIPRGCRIISNDTWTVFLNILLCRLEYTTTGVPIALMKGCISKLLQELDRILNRFGHRLSNVSVEWLEILCTASVIDPSIQRIPESVITSLLSKSTMFASWLDTDVDHLLYSIVSSFISFSVMMVMARCISLNSLSTEQPVTIASCRACLPFFNKSILSGEDFALQHIAIYKELLEAYGGCNFRFTQRDIKFCKECIVTVEDLLKHPPHSEESKDVCDKVMVSVGLAQIRLGETPTFDIFSYAPESGQNVSKQDPEKLREYVQKKKQGLESDLDLPVGTSVMEETNPDIHDLLSCIGEFCNNFYTSPCVEVTC